MRKEKIKLMITGEFFYKSTILELYMKTGKIPM